MSPSLDTVRRVALWVSVRLRLGRLVGAAWWILSLGLTSAAVVLAVHKIWPAKLSQVGARIWELPITYSGRTYAEGKKITWRDGLAAVLHILRYNLFPPGGDWRRLKAGS